MKKTTSNPETSKRNLVLRFELKRGDAEAVGEITASTGFFSPQERDVAVELAEDRLQKGEASDYHFIVGEFEGEAVGYACYGAIACTVASYDLYWIVVQAGHQGLGWGRMLLSEAEKRVYRAGGRRLYVETSSREQYIPTRAFYEKCGYRKEAVIEDFYAPRDSKVLYLKILS